MEAMTGQPTKLIETNISSILTPDYRADFDRVTTETCVKWSYRIRFKEPNEMKTLEGCKLFQSHTTMKKNKNISSGGVTVSKWPLITMISFSGLKAIDRKLTRCRDHSNSSLLR